MAGLGVTAEADSLSALDLGQAVASLSVEALLAEDTLLGVVFQAVDLDLLVHHLLVLSVFSLFLCLFLPLSRALSSSIPSPSFPLRVIILLSS